MEFIFLILQADFQEDLPEQNFFFDQRAIAAGKKRKQRQQEGQHFPPRKKPPVPRGPCWFCLGGEQVEKHLVVSVGDHVSIRIESPIKYAPKENKTSQSTM